MEQVLPAQAQAELELATPENVTKAKTTLFDNLINWITVGVLAAELIVITLQVVSRHIFKSPLAWTEEIARMLLTWLMFSGGVIAMKRGEHTRVTAFIRLFSGRIKTAISLGINTILVGYLAVLGYQAFQLTLESANEKLPASQLSGALVSAPMPIAIGLMLVYLLQQIWQEVKEVRHSAALLGLAGLTVVGVLTSVLLPLLGEVTPIIVLLTGFLVTAALGMPLAFALGLISLTYLVGIGGVPLTILPIKLLGGVDSFVLLAIPLFILGGALMEIGGISQRIVNFATALVGHVRGGLAMVVLVAEMLFSGISGSSAADVSAISSLLVPAMKKAGYGEEEAVSLVASASAMGILVPPCLTMVVLGSLANLSIVGLFLAGFIPAFVIAAVLMVLIFFKARRQNWPVAGRTSGKQIAQSTKKAIIPLGMPLIIFGGIFTGIVTVTEAALIAVAYALLVGLFFYKELRLKDLPRLFVGSATVTAMTLWILAAASLFAWVLAREQVPQLFAKWITSVGGGVFVFMCLTILIFVVIGALLEGLPALLIFGPILFPIAISLGIDPIHYGIVIVAAMGIAFFLPPIGIGLFIACGVGQVDINKVIPRYMPYLAALLIGLLIVAFVPFFSLILPQLVLGYGGR